LVGIDAVVSIICKF